MFRLIYFEPGRPYGVIDSKSQIELIAKQGLLGSKRINVICVIDYANRAILNKSKYFDIHRELIDEIIFDQRLINSTQPGQK
jgi:hypothetical protein